MPDMVSPYEDPNHWAKVYLDYEASRDTPSIETKQPTPVDDYLAEMDKDTEALREAYERMGSKGQG